MMIMNERIGWLPPKYISIKTETGNIQQTSQKIKANWKNIFPRSTFDFFFVEQYFDAQYSLDRRFGKM